MAALVDGLVGAFCSHDCGRFKSLNRAATRPFLWCWCYLESAGTFWTNNISCCAINCGIRGTEASFQINWRLWWRQRTKLWQCSSQALGGLISHWLCLLSEVWVLKCAFIFALIVLSFISSECGAAVMHCEVIWLLNERGELWLVEFWWGVSLEISRTETSAAASFAHWPVANVSSRAFAP